MRAQDVTDKLDLALTVSGCDQALVIHKPRLLSDNGSSYVSAELADWLDTQNLGHVRGAACAVPIAPAPSVTASASSMLVFLMTIFSQLIRPSQY